MATDCTVLCYCIVVLFLPLKSVEGALRYLPGQQNHGVWSLVENYFNLGLQYSEILAFLTTIHGIQLSLRQLKRILRSIGVRRRKNHTTIEEIVDTIEQELNGTGSCLATDKCIRGYD